MKNNSLTKNLLICGDNLKALDNLKKQGIKVDLIYLDPPFFSNRHYEVVWGDEAEIRSFKDRWAGGIHVYIEWMKERIIKMYDALKDTGSFYLHCDWHASHSLKVMLDEIFGHKNFRNEIIWYYKTFHGQVKNYFPKKHDTIFFYTKSHDWKFNQLFDDDYKNTIDFKRWNKYLVQGNKIIGANMPMQDTRFTRFYRRWKRQNKREPKPSDIVYELKGQPLDTLWDIKAVDPKDKDRLGYPTQKPEALLENIIKASSNKNDLILDPFCGCGTAMAVAHKLNRKWIGIDISPTAISLIEKRLEKLGAIKGKDFDSIGMPTTTTALKSLEPFEFQNWVINEMQAKQSKRIVGDKGIDGHIEKSLYSEEAGIQVKQSEKIGRNIIDNFETALERKKYQKGYVVGFSFTKGSHEEVARVKEEKGLYIKLIKVEDLLKRKPGLLK